MTNKIWYELVNMKFGEIYLSKYLGTQRSLKKTFNIITLLISTSGLLSWKYFENIVWIALAIIAFMQLLVLIKNDIIRSDKEIEDISSLRMMYTRYFNKLERLWTDYHFENITNQEALEKFFTFRETDWEMIEKLDGKLCIKKYNRLIKAADLETRDYITKFHNNE